MKSTFAAVLCVLALSSGSAFAAGTLNGIAFSKLELSAQQREYRGEKFNACVVHLSIAKTGLFAGTLTNKAGVKASCKDIPLSTLLPLVAASKPWTALIKGLGTASFGAEEAQNLKKSSIFCELFFNKSPPAGPLDMACYNAANGASIVK